MPRTCIICGVAANSGEHIFPAALGGRRVNRGIYCGTHNNGFSGLANVLAQQLSVVNALLGVRPDHADRARVLNVTTPDGDDLIISAGSMTRASTSSVDRDERMHLQLVLGGPDGLPAIGYVAMTFFAHYFQDEARQAGLNPVKAFVQGHGENTFVWWESDATTYNLPANPFEFGHTIILTTSAATGEAKAVISLFQTLTFGIALGYVEGAMDRTVVVFIDPHADHPPADTQQRISDTVELAVQRPDPMYAHLEQMVREGRGQGQLQDLFAKIEQWKFRTEMASVLDRLNAAATLPIRERLREIQRIVEEQAARIYRLMNFVVKDFRNQAAGQDHVELVLAVLSAQVKLNDARDSLSEEAEIPFARAVAAFIAELNAKLTQGAIDMDYLWLLFSGGPGAHIIAQTMFEPIMSLMRGTSSGD
jgi:hypothetical protein